MRLKKYLLDNRAFSLIELLVVMAIVSIMIAMGGIVLAPSIAKRRVLNCGSKIIADIHLIQSRAQSEGHRAVFQLTNAAKAQDIDGDGLKEYYIGFLDKNKNDDLDSNETFIHGTEGDELCDSSVSVDDNSTLRKIVFSPLGMVMSGSTDKNLYLRDSSTAVRVQLVSITGMLRSYVNTDNCTEDNSSGCSTHDKWEELK